MTDKKDERGLFDFMLARIEDTQMRTGRPEPQAFGEWFARMYFLEPHDLRVSDGPFDGRVDCYFKTDDGHNVTHHIMNLKYTREYNKKAPRQFYDEIISFWHAFSNKDGREDFLNQSVVVGLRPHYRQLFEHFDAGNAKLLFVTNHRSNDNYAHQVKNLPVEIICLDELIQHLIDDIDEAMPRTPDIVFGGIQALLSPDQADTTEPTSIIFARLIDFIRYMQKDPYDLLFARNVRVALSPSRSQVNKDIHDTFMNQPEEFVFSNNGITMLCERQNYDPGTKELSLENPRVVNGSQTLHSIRDVKNPSANARVMVRIIKIPTPRGDDLSDKIEHRKDVIRKIAVRSNQQNPIKKWDLVSNDDFQLELFRFFRRKGCFYERREKEWKFRGRALRAVGIDNAIGIRKLTQFIASYYWSRKDLGPANAKGSVGELFEGNAYELICKATPELAYQLYLAGSNSEECLSTLGRSKQYIRYLKPYIGLSLFALSTKALKSAGADWGDVRLTQMLEEQWPNWYVHEPAWRRLTKACIDCIHAHYESEAKAVYKAENYEPTYANFFKSPKSIDKILKAPVPKSVVKLAAQVLESN
jgi:hypothetical protein